MFACFGFGRRCLAQPTSSGEWTAGAAGRLGPPHLQAAAVARRPPTARLRGARAPLPLARLDHASEEGRRGARTRPWRAPADENSQARTGARTPPECSTCSPNAWHEGHEDTRDEGWAPRRRRRRSTRSTGYAESRAGRTSHASGGPSPRWRRTQWRWRTPAGSATSSDEGGTSGGPPRLGVG